MKRAARLALVFLPALAVARAGAETIPQAPPRIHHVRVQSIIHPVSAQFVVESLRAAGEAGAVAFVLELDTPGGLLSSTREIFQAMLAAKPPVVVYVAPAGAQAASAGFFLLMAADIAAMAPGTNTGAAHPVAGDGKDVDGVMGDKVEQDAAATIRSLAARSGRNVALAEAAVVESRSFTAEEALRDRLIDLTAPDLAALLAAIDGREVTKASGAKVVLETTGIEVERVEWRPFQRLLAVLAHPNVAYILLTLGFLGLYYELATPGAVLPGVLGGICLILAFFALSVLPVNYAGVALVVLGLLFFLAEIKITSYGLLTVAGVASLVLGGMMLFKTAEPALRVSWSVLLGLGFVALVLAGLGSALVLRAHRRPVATGREGLVGLRGEARPGGKVFVHGELWQARLAAGEAPVAPGSAVEVVAVDGLTLTVRPLKGAPA
jgi:membrane-bound serine protease (ClpP class)